MMMMIRMMKTQNGHNSTNFEATTSRFCMVIGLNDTSRIMMTMMIMMLMSKTQNSHNSTNFEATTSRFCIVIDINDTYWLHFHAYLSLWFVNTGMIPYKNLLKNGAMRHSNSACISRFVTGTATCQIWKMQYMLWVLLTFKKLHLTMNILYLYMFFCSSVNCLAWQL